MPLINYRPKYAIDSETEKERLRALWDHHILDVDMQEELEGLVSLASKICGTPVSLINLLDAHHQITKACSGIEIDKIPRESSFCQYTILDNKMMIVENASEDERFCQNPFVIGEPNIRFYAGVPLENENGYNLGTICVIDSKPRELNDSQKESLKLLANEVVSRLDQKRIQQKLAQSVEEKEVLLAEVHHRVKNNLAIISGLLELESFQAKDAATEKTLKHSQMRIQSMATIHELLYKANEFTNLPFKSYIAKIVQSIKTTYHQDDKDIRIKHTSDNITLNVNQAIPCALIINELVTNAYEHAFTDKKEGVIEIELSGHNSSIYLCVRDSGKGLPADFNLENPGSLGLKLVGTLTKQLDADIYIDKENGTTVCLTFQKQDIKGSSSALLKQ